MGTHARGEKNRSRGRRRRANTSAPPKRVEAGDGTGGGKEGGRGLGGGCKTDMQSALLGEVADIKGAGRCRVERKGSRVVSHLHSPTKFLYFETKGMRQNRVRRVSPVEQQTASEQRQRS